MLEKAPVAVKALGKYKAQLEDYQQDRRPLYRNRTEMKDEERNRGGKSRKDNWFRAEGFTSTLSLMPTPDSQLARQTTEALDRCPPPTGTKTKVIERGGRTTQHELVSSNPFPRKQCHREDCGMCAEKASNGMCYRPCVGYLYTCNRCEEERQQRMEAGTTPGDTTLYKYIGETSRTPYTRHLQHLTKYKARITKGNGRNGSTLDEDDERSGTFMWSHTRDHHGGLPGPDTGRRDYCLEVEGTFRDTMTRQVDEAVRIGECGWGEDVLASRLGHQSAPKFKLMNSKNEFFKPKNI